MTTKTKFNAGDVVRLNSGGPWMTVICDPLENPPHVTCIWFMGEQLSTPKTFHQDMLTTGNGNEED